MWTGERGLQHKRLPIRLDRFLEAIHAREGNREVLEHLGIVGLRAQREPVRRDCRVEISGSLQRERLVEVVEALRLQLAFGSAAEEAAQPGHSLVAMLRRWTRCRITEVTGRDRFETNERKAQSQRESRCSRRIASRDSFGCEIE